MHVVSRRSQGYEIQTDALLLADNRLLVSSLSLGFLRFELLNLVLEGLHLCRIDAVVLTRPHFRTNDRQSEHGPYLAEQLGVTFLPPPVLLFKAFQLSITRSKFSLCDTSLLLDRIEFC